MVDKIQLNRLQQRILRKISLQTINFNRSDRIACDQMGFSDQKSCLMNPGVISSLRSGFLGNATRKALQILFDMEPLKAYLYNSIEFVDRNNNHIAWLYLAYGNTDQYGPGINRLVFWSFED